MTKRARLRHLAALPALVAVPVVAWLTSRPSPATLLVAPPDCAEPNPVPAKDVFARRQAGLLPVLPRLPTTTRK